MDVPTPVVTMAPCLLLIALAATAGCEPRSSHLAPEDVAHSNLNIAPLVDPEATPETRALWRALHRSKEQAVLFGHQNANIEGLGWKGEPNRSDVRSTVGDWPAIFGFGFWPDRIELTRKRMLDAHAAGGLIELSWHPDNPVTGGKYMDKRPDSIRAVLPGGEGHQQLVTWLDQIADLVLSLKDGQGRPIPVLFRPWHEHTGGWFWWGSKSGTPEEYIQLWRFTVQYLRDTRDVHQLIYVISPASSLDGQPDYLNNRFPGLEWVDVLGFDHYVHDVSNMAGLLKDMQIVERLATEHGKLAAATELGYRDGLSKYNGNDFWAGRVLPLLVGPDAPKIAWLLTWRNGHADHYWVPTREMPAANDFRRFASSDRIWLADNWQTFLASP